MDKYIAYVNPRENIKGFLIFILILAGLGMAVGAVFISNPPNTPKIVDNITDERFSSPNVLAYAYWAGDKSEVKTFDLSNGEDSLVATLPLTVKHIKLLPSNEIIYINDTDESDYGSHVAVRGIPNGDERIVVVASEGVRIDDYRISPNGQYVATWEVAVAPETGQLLNGISRVYVTDIATGVKNQIISQTADVPVSYPVAVLDNGQVFMDKFLPNDSAGWAYGLSVADFAGGAIQDISVVSNGTYGSQPVLSPDGSALIFTGYDGSKGNGADIVRGSRRAIISANTVDVLQLDTLTRTRLASLSTDHYYSGAWWDEVTGNAFISLISKNAEETGTYSYQIATDLFEKIDTGSLAELSPNPKKVLAVLESGVSLVGSVSVDEGVLGNLGSKYEQPLEGVYVYNQNENDVVLLSMTGGFVQPLGVKPASYFEGDVVLFSDVGEPATSTGGLKGKSDQQLQLNTVSLKPKLEPKRTNQQSSNLCRDVAANACNEFLGTNYSGSEALNAKHNPSNPVSEEFRKCVIEQWAIAVKANCADSPLYLYGPEGMSVNVKIGVPVTESKAPYNPINGYSGVLTGKGGIVIGGVMYPSLEYDYQLGGKFVPPTRGVVINRATIDSQLREYAEKLGMNEVEAYDFIKYIQANTSGEKFFLSHFSHNISSKLLPLHFTPQPDSYTNIIFYIDEESRNLQDIEEMGEFEKIRRNGYTAVEISYIIR